MSALDKLREDVYGEKYTRKVIRKKKISKKPVGFYKDKKGATRPITSRAKRSGAQKTRVVTRQVPRIPRSRRGAHGWEIDFPSKSSSKIYTTTFWTEDYKQFKEGEITCNCPGWRYRRTCRHLKEVEQMAQVKMFRGLQGPALQQAQPSTGTGNRIVNASSATRLKFDKAVKGALTTGLVGFHMDSTHVIALLVDVNEAIQGASKDIAKFVESLPMPDAWYRQITQASLGKSIKDSQDPKDREHLFIGDTTYRKEPVKVALRTLGGRKIRIYSMGTDQPVFLMNDADEAVLIAPYITVDSSKGNDDDVLRLEDIAA